eukprot:TRINITY_DN1090_c0_g1_i2.p1 TRINITY_DN1090_c0_g1~~TRINITY_DN1090_c0_g1_i2.p1  ORF type:complete len:156 (+),score=28.57 TRINITY_DN1090_c0_g1_i2:101-568(+)
MSPSDSTSSPKVESKTKIHNTDENSDDESKQPKLSNDELLYDPEMDGKDEDWITELRKGYYPPGYELQPSPKLSCSHCITTVCVDCQPHEFYHNQYRAMFVMNCICPGDKPPFEKENKETGEKEYFYPVFCEVCRMEIAAYGQDELYHFYSVLAD